MNDEKWKDVEGTNGYYQISNIGRFRNQNKILKAYLGRCGYYYVSVWDKRKLLHRLIADAFIPNPDNKPQIDHINGIKTDNRISNLRWATHFENSNNPSTKFKAGHPKGVKTSNEFKERCSIRYKGEKHPMYGKKHLLKSCIKMSNSHSKAVVQSTLNNALVNEFPSAKEASNQTNIAASNITCCCRNVRKTAGGYKWRFKDDIQLK